MVKILANGEIVSDDDPRARSSSRTTQRQSNSNVNTQRGEIPQQQYARGEGGQQVSIFQRANQQLLSMGVPPFHVGETTVDPIVSVGLTMALIFFGLPGLLFGGVLFLVSQWSGSDGNGPPEFVSRFFGTRPSATQQAGSGSNINRRRGTPGTGSGGNNSSSGGAGYRLGHD